MGRLWPAPRAASTVASGSTTLISCRRRKEARAEAERAAERTRWARYPIRAAESNRHGGFVKAHVTGFVTAGRGL
jgi:hypothetical protein